MSGLVVCVVSNCVSRQQGSGGRQKVWLVGLALRRSLCLSDGQRGSQIAVTVSQTTAAGGEVELLWISVTTECSDRLGVGVVARSGSGPAVS